MKQLQIAFTGYVRVYWCVPEQSIGEGLRPLKCDTHIVEMNKASQIAKNILLYVDHHNLLESHKSKLVDDPFFNGQKEFPDVTDLDNRKKLHESEQGGGSDEDSEIETIYVD